MQDIFITGVNAERVRRRPELYDGVPCIGPLPVVPENKKR
jgi:hypothetical protein